MQELKPRDNPPGEPDPDGVRVVASSAGGRRSTFVYQALALFFAASCVGYILMPTRSGAPRAGDHDTPPPPETEHSIRPAAPGGGPAGNAAAVGATGAATEGSAPAAASRSVTPRRMASQRPSQDPPEEAPVLQLKPGETPPKEIKAADYIQALHDAGIYEGIGAFPPPGTSPPLEGLAVPEDYEIPEGYVRHYQSTDDGQSIEPILMYSPFFEFFDENDNPIAIPEDRVVRPEHAPPGFPIRPIVIPPERQPGDVSR